MIPVLYISLSLIFFTEEQLEEEAGLEWNDTESLEFFQKNKPPVYPIWFWAQFM